MTNEEIQAEHLKVITGECARQYNYQDEEASVHTDVTLNAILAELLEHKDGYPAYKVQERIQQIQLSLMH